ncbi:MAG: hypothetical protein R3307_08765, partial [Anaerolineales bacterium]|nr:hypothetical protein [Anaerolineales bacterium]
MLTRISSPAILFALMVGILPDNAAADDIDQLSNGMIVLIRQIQEKRDSDGQIKRFNQGKSLGCFNADFVVEADLPPELREGLFKAPGSYSAKVRFASASTFDDREKDLRGMSIKVLGVKGESLLGTDGAAGEQDFLLNSYPALFVDTPETFYEFIEATYNDERWKVFVSPLDPHLKS